MITHIRGRGGGGLKRVEGGYKMAYFQEVVPFPAKLFIIFRELYLENCN